MKTVVDNLISKTGWTGSTGTVTFPTENEIQNYIAGLNSKSLIIKFAEGSLNDYAIKTFSSPIDVTEYDELVFHIWSREKLYQGLDYQLSGDFAYKINFIAGGDEYYIPTSSRLEDVTIDISDVTSIERIKITALFNDEDYIIVSYMVAVRDQIPRDIWQDTKEQLEYDLNSLYGKITDGVTDKGILIGTASGAAGEKSIIFETSYPFAEKYAVILIDDGSNSENHQIDHNDEVEYFFNSLYDGAALQNTFSSAPVYLIVPVNYGLSEKEILLPGIAIWGMSPEEIFRGNKEDEVRDTFKTDETVQSRITPAIYQYVIIIDVEARHNRLRALMNRLVRHMIAREYIWINGRKIDVAPEGGGVDIEPTEGFNQIPKSQHFMRLELKEELFDRETKVKTVTNTRTYNII